MSGILSDSKQFHLQISEGDAGKYAILCGDPGRVPKIAEYFESPVKIAENREYTIYTGFLEGEKVTAASTGIGGPSAAICAEELIKCGVHTLIRTGTSGGIREDVCGGDLCIASAAVRDDGTSREYLPISYPAVADFDVCTALSAAASELCSGKEGDAFHVGAVQSKDSFYGETNPETMPVSGELMARWEAYKKLGCLTSEMECSALFSVALTRGVRAGGVLLAIWNVERSKSGAESPVVLDTDKAVRCAVLATKKLILSDRENK